MCDSRIKESERLGSSKRANAMGEVGSMPEAVDPPVFGTRLAVGVLRGGSGCSGVGLALLAGRRPYRHNLSAQLAHGRCHHAFFRHRLGRGGPFVSRPVAQ